MADQDIGERATISGGIGRRAVMGSAVALAAVAGTTSLPAFAATSTNVRTFRGRYALRCGDTVAGLFASPRGKRDAGIIVVMGDENTAASRTEAVALDYASAGHICFAPDLAKSYAHAPAMSRSERIADLVKKLPQLGDIPQSNGSVKFIFV